MSANLPIWTNYPIRIGCPVWRAEGWLNTVYQNAAQKQKSLRYYSQYFPTVEGNSTFYSLPSQQVASNWASDAHTDFHICFKVPRLISHEMQLHKIEFEFEQFVERLLPLANNRRLGPTFLQLGPKFDRRGFSHLLKFLMMLPSHMQWAVEFRHQDWFVETTEQLEVESLMKQQGIDRVLFDASYLHQISTRSEAEQVAQSRKPNPPIYKSTTSVQPLVRLIGSDLLEANDVNSVMQHWSHWFKQIVEWVLEGKRPYLFIHTPNDQFSPTLCRAVYHEIQQIASSNDLTLPDLPEFVTPIKHSEKPMQQLFDFS